MIARSILGRDTVSIAEDTGRCATEILQSKYLDAEAYRLTVPIIEIMLCTVEIDHDAVVHVSTHFWTISASSWIWTIITNVIIQKVW